MPRKSIRARIAAHKGEGVNACGGNKLAGLVSTIGRPSINLHLFLPNNGTCCKSKVFKCKNAGCADDNCKVTVNTR